MFQLTVRLRHCLAFGKFKMATTTPEFPTATHLEAPETPIVRQAQTQPPGSHESCQHCAHWSSQGAETAVHAVDAAPETKVHNIKGV